MGAGVSPSPRISVVTPWLTFPTTRESPNSSRPPEWPWMSMKPGETTCPDASMIRRADDRNMPRGVMRAMRPLEIAMSP
jgi:hypothetical protein